MTQGSNFIKHLGAMIAAKIRLKEAGETSGHFPCGCGEEDSLHVRLEKNKGHARAHCEICGIRMIE